ncbi:hypothetical protein Tco_0915842 [Tanacetum coccineum]
MVTSIRPEISFEALIHVEWVARTSGGSTYPAGGTSIAGIGCSKNGNLSSTDSTIRRLRYHSMKLGPVNLCFLKKALKTNFLTTVVKCKYVTRNTRKGPKNEENTDSYETLQRNHYDSVTP